jgi:arylsulfatase A-like enzyme/ubiquinone/menaquinone biosynthesis C-methylase UbiE
MTRPKKIILIVIDTLRADHLGCYGYKRNTSPNIDELCRNSIKFVHAFSPCSFTLPSHGSVFTSKYPSHHGVGFNQNGCLNTDSEITLAEVLKYQGYGTAAFVSTIVLRKETNLNAGFDVYDDKIKLIDQTEAVWEAKAGRRDGSETTIRALKWIEENEQKDFFLFIHYFDVHGPYIPPTPNNTIFLNDAYYGDQEQILRLVPSDHPIDGLPTHQALRTDKISERALDVVEKQPHIEIANGWHYIEYFGSIPTRWIKNNAEIIIYSAENCEYKLCIKTMSFYSNSTLEIYANEEMVFRQIISPESFVDVRATIHLKQGANIVRLHVPEGCQRPSNIPEMKNNDPRCLSLAIQGDFLESMCYEKDARYYISQYDGGIRYCDSIIGQLLAKLKDLNIFDETLIIITSDHGEALGEYNVFFNHGLSVTPDQISVPLIIKPHNGWKVKSGEIDLHVSTIDIAPTILSLCDHDYGNLDLEGQSLKGLIEFGEDPIMIDRILMSENEMQYALIGPQSRVELFKKPLPTSKFYTQVPELIESIEKLQILKREKRNKEYTSYIDVKDLPFDLYTRNYLIYQLLEKVRNKMPLRILDVGGRNGQLGKFFEKDKYYVLDLKSRELDDASIYIQGDSRSIPIKDNSQDIVISSDMYEHIPSEFRISAIKEMLRVSKNFVILAAPFSSSEVENAEELANQFYLKIAGEQHPMLKEHIENSLPSEETLEIFLKEHGYDFFKISTNNISNWHLIQSLIFYSHKHEIPPEKLNSVFRFYNENFAVLGDHINPTYRKIYLIGEKSTLPKIEMKNESFDIFKYQELVIKVFDAFGAGAISREFQIKAANEMIKQKQNYESYLEKESCKKDELNCNQEAVLIKKTEYISCLEDALSKKDEDISSLVETLRKKDDYIPSLEDALRKKDEDISSLVETLRKKDDDIPSLEDALRKKDEDISSLVETLRKKDDYIPSLEDALRKKDENISSLVETLRKKDDYITSLEEIKYIDDVRIKSQEKLISERNAYIELSKCSNNNNKKTPSVEKVPFRKR